MLITLSKMWFTITVTYSRFWRLSTYKGQNDDYRKKILANFEGWFLYAKWYILTGAYSGCYVNLDTKMKRQYQFPLRILS